jgi:hypothetical protein
MGVLTVTVRLQWFRCDAAGANCAAVTSMAASPLTYALTAADIGSRLKLVQTATDALPGTNTQERLTGVIAAEPPSNTTPPTIAGTAREGEVLTGSPGTWDRGSGATFSYRWQRCGPADFTSCGDIADATSLSYTLTAADIGHQVRIVERATGPQAFVDAASFNSETVTAATTPTPPAPPAPPSPPSPSPLPPVNPRLLSPFPVVAIAGRVVPGGVQVTLLRVRGPRGTRVTVRCRGRGCPFRRARLSIRRRTVRIRRLQRRLRAGVVIEVLATKPGTIGKYTRFQIRRGRPPARRDACVRPGSRTPSRCPSAR